MTNREEFNMNVLITGANRGLGLALAEVGLENNYNVLAGVRSIEDSDTEQLVNLQKEFKDHLKIIQLDVTDEDSIVEAAKNVKNSKENLDVIINNAGILNAREKSIEELDLEELKFALDVNTLGPVRVIKHFLPLLKQGNRQSIINVTSDAGSLTNAGNLNFPYGLSKSATNMLSEKLDDYLKEEDIQVLAVHPGFMKTDMGGPEAKARAPIHPKDAAKGIFDMIERKVKIESDYVFVDYTGKSMEI